jgi:hypothetical protein
VILPLSKSAPLDAVGRDPPFLLLPTAVNTNPSAAMVESPSTAGQG